MGYGKSFSRSCGSGYLGSGFTNAHAGSKVSSTHAQQHVGQSFGGYTKSRSSSTGNFYMSSTRSNGKRS